MISSWGRSQFAPEELYGERAARSRYHPGAVEEAELFRKENVGKVFMGEHELTLGMTRHVIERILDE
jgi:hypothetical protein